MLSLQAVAALRELLRQDPDNQLYQTDFKKVKAMHAKMTAGIDALDSHRFSTPTYLADADVC